MLENSIRSVFKNNNIPKQERTLVKANYSYEDNLRTEIEYLTQFADFSKLNDRVEKMLKEEKIKADPVQNFLYQLKKAIDEKDKV